MTKKTTDWKKSAEASIKSDLVAYNDGDTAYSSPTVRYNSYDASKNLEGKNQTDFDKTTKKSTGWGKSSKNTTDWD